MTFIEKCNAQSYAFEQCMIKFRNRVHNHTLILSVKFFNYFESIKLNNFMIGWKFGYGLSFIRVLETVESRAEYFECAKHSISLNRAQYDDVMLGLRGVVEDYCQEKGFSALAFFESARACKGLMYVMDSDSGTALTWKQSLREMETYLPVVACNPQRVQVLRVMEQVAAVDAFNGRSR